VCKIKKENKKAELHTKHKKDQPKTVCTLSPITLILVTFFVWQNEAKERMGTVNKNNILIEKIVEFTN